MSIEPSSRVKLQQVELSPRAMVDLGDTVLSVLRASPELTAEMRANPLHLAGALVVVAGGILAALGTIDPLDQVKDLASLLQAAIRKANPQKGG